MLTRTRLLIALVPAAVLAFIAALFVPNAEAHFTDPGAVYDYTSTLKVSNSGTNFAEKPSTLNGTAFPAGGTVTVAFSVTTNNSSEAWPATSYYDPANQSYRITMVSNNAGLACHNSGLAQRSNLVPTTVTNTTDDHIGGMTLGTASTSSGSFSTTVTLPSTFPTDFTGNRAKICVESIDRYGDKGGIFVDTNGGGSHEVQPGVGVHCDPTLGTCTTVTVGTVIAGNEDPVCTNCHRYNNTARIVSEVIVRI